MREIKSCLSIKQWACLSIPVITDEASDEHINTRLHFIISKLVDIDIEQKMQCAFDDVIKFDAVV